MEAVAKAVPPAVVDAEACTVVVEEFSGLNAEACALVLVMSLFVARSLAVAFAGVSFMTKAGGLEVPKSELRTSGEYFRSRSTESAD